MPPKAAPKKAARAPAAIDPTPDPTPPTRVSRWVDVDEDTYRLLLSRPAAAEDWAEFSRKAYASTDPLTCDHRDLVALELCFTSLCFCRDRRMRFPQTEFVMRTTQQLLHALETDPANTSPVVAGEMLSSAVISSFFRPHLCPVPDEGVVPLAGGGSLLGRGEGSDGPVRRLTAAALAGDPVRLLPVLLHRSHSTGAECSHPRRSAETHGRGASRRGRPIANRQY